MGRKEINMNQVIVTGRVTKDVELKYTQSQMAVARFNVALDRGKDKDGKDKGADFPSCVAFGRTAENLDRFSGKGLRVAVIGHIQTGSYEDRDGKKVYTTDVIADRVEIIDFKEKIAQNEPQSPAGGIPEGFAAMEDDDVPF